MARSRVKKLVVAGVAVVALVGGIKAISHARGPGDRMQAFEADPTGLHGRMGPMQRWRGLTKEEFDGESRARFARLDRNSDGVIDRAEVEAALTAMQSRFRDRFRERVGGGREGGPTPQGERAGVELPPFLRRIDGNRDGKITREEAQTAMRRLFGRADLDGDGRLTDADLPPMLRGQKILAQPAQSEGRGWMRGRGGRGDGVGPLQALRGADANGDGIITLDEALAHANAQFDRFDRNKDNVVDTADFDAFRKEMLDYRVARFLHEFGAKDGKITREQFMARANERFAELDTDASGRITRDEAPRWGGRHHGRGHDRDRPERGPRDGQGPQGPQGPMKGPEQK
jgi:Ca2+-binding EF-hand superfamily protein